MMNNLNEQQRKFMENQDFMLNKLGKVSSDLLTAKCEKKTADEIELILKNMLRLVNDEIVNSDES